MNLTTQLKATALLSALIFAGCGSDKKEVTSEQPQVTPTTPAQSAPVTQPDAGAGATQPSTPPATNGGLNREPYYDYWVLFKTFSLRNQGYGIERTRNEVRNGIMYQTVEYYRTFDPNNAFNFAETAKVVTSDRYLIKDRALSSEQRLSRSPNEYQAGFVSQVDSNSITYAPYNVQKDTSLQIKEVYEKRDISSLPISQVTSYFMSTIVAFADGDEASNKIAVRLGNDKTPFPAGSACLVEKAISRNQDYVYTDDRSDRVRSPLSSDEIASSKIWAGIRWTLQPGSPSGLSDFERALVEYEPNKAVYSEYFPAGDFTLDNYLADLRQRIASSDVSSEVRKNIQETVDYYESKPCSLYNQTAANFIEARIEEALK